MLADSSSFCLPSLLPAHAHLPQAAGQIKALEEENGKLK